MARTKQTARPSSTTVWHARSFQERTSVVDDAWAISEIAENILLNLPMEDLLFAQGVCTGWKILIRSSPALQERLFMRPRPERSCDGMPAREYNPLLLKHMAMFFKSDGSSHRNVKDVAWATSGSRLAFLRRDASWRNMLLAQPPFTIFEKAEQTHAMGGDGLSVGSVERPDGVRMGMPYDAAVQAMMSGGFRTLMDGEPSYQHEVLDSNSSEAGYDLSTMERVFGGKNKFTLFTRRTISCVQPSFGHGARRFEQQQFTSGGSELTDIMLSPVKPSNQSMGRNFGWWTENGYIAGRR